jgi:hypothetical protein
LESVLLGNGYIRKNITKNIHMQKQIITAFVIAIILSLSLGTFFGNLYTNRHKQTEIKNSAEASYKSGWSDAMKTLKEAGSLGILPEGMEIKTLSGTIQSISENSLTVKVSDPNLMSSVSLVVRTITVDANTKIRVLTQRDSSQVQKEMVTFTNTLKNNSIDPQNMPTPPVLQDSHDGSKTDLKEGQVVMIESVEDIRDKVTFTATEIKIQPISDVSQLPRMMQDTDLPTPPLPVSIPQTGSSSLPKTTDVPTSPTR